MSGLLSFLLLAVEIALGVAAINAAAFTFAAGLLRLGRRR